MTGRTQYLPGTTREVGARAVLAGRNLFDDETATPQERQLREAADQRAMPYVVFRDRDHMQHIIFLEGARVVIGRAEDAPVSLPWDRGVSRSHAILQRTARGWSVLDGRSLNGTFVNRERVSGARPLDDGDIVQVGETALAYHDPA